MLNFVLSWKFYIKSYTLDTIFIKINCKKNLICILKIIFILIKYKLYIYYLDKNVFTSYKSLFIIKNIEKTFYDNWHKILFTSIEFVFKKKIGKL